MTEEVIRQIMTQRPTQAFGQAFRRAQTFPVALRQAQQQLGKGEQEQRLAELKLQAFPEESETKRALQQAQTLRALQQARQPMAGQALTGAAGEAFALERLRQQFGEQHPVFQRALKLFNDKQHSLNARANYFAANLDLKNLPTDVKMQKFIDFNNFNAQRQKQNLTPVSYDNWATQFSPEGELSKQTPEQQLREAENIEPLTGSHEILPHEHGMPRIPNTPFKLTEHTKSIPSEFQVPKEISAFIPAPGVNFEQKADQLAKGLQKKNTPTQILNQAVQLSGALELMNSIDENIFRPYAGIGGKARYGADSVEQQRGRFDPKFVAYETFRNSTAINLSDQIRKAYGTSIDMNMIRRLDKLANPATWKQNPETAIALWEETKRAIRLQAGVYDRAVTHPISAIPPPVPEAQKLSVANIQKAHEERLRAMQPRRLPFGREAVPTPTGEVIRKISAAAPAGLDIEASAKKAGISVEVLRSRLERARR